MSFPNRLWLVGVGNMGGAMLARWIADGADPASIVAIDPGAPDVPTGVTLVATPPRSRPNVLVLAIKPQLLDVVALSLADAQPDLLVSILAGVEAATLARKIPARTVVRAMPNLPVSIGRGVVALYTSSDNLAVRAIAETLMTPLGLVEWIDDEALFHAVVALSGSGPGFVYRFVEAMAAAGAGLGLPVDMARRFAVATVEGAAALAAASGETLTVLADRVASPGGTTHAGLNVLDNDAAMATLMARTLDTAARRSAELATAAR